MELDFTAAALRTDPVNEAIATGLMTLANTWNFQTAYNSMVTKGVQNGAVDLIKSGLVLDVIVAIGRSLE